MLILRLIGSVFYNHTLPKCIEQHPVRPLSIQVGQLRLTGSVTLKRLFRSGGERPTFHAAFVGTPHLSRER